MSDVGVIKQIIGAVIDVEFDKENINKFLLKNILLQYNRALLICSDFFWQWMHLQSNKEVFRAINL